MFLWNLLCSSFRQLLLALSRHTTKKSLALSVSLPSSFRYLYQINQTPSQSSSPPPQKKIYSNWAVQLVCPLGSLSEGSLELVLLGLATQWELHRHHGQNCSCWLSCFGHSHEVALLGWSNSSVIRMPTHTTMWRLMCCLTKLPILDEK